MFFVTIAIYIGFDLQIRLVLMRAVASRRKQFHNTDSWQFSVSIHTLWKRQWTMFNCFQFAYSYQHIRGDIAAGKWVQCSQEISMNTDDCISHCPADYPEAVLLTSNLCLRLHVNKGDMKNCKYFLEIASYHEYFFWVWAQSMTENVAL